MQSNTYIDSFLKKHHLSQAQITWLVPDASKRHYARIINGKDSFILMDSPKQEKPKQFIIVDQILRHHHLPAPRIIAKDLKHGLILLEDFGSCQLSQAIQNNPKSDEEITLNEIKRDNMLLNIKIQRVLDL